MNERKVYPSDVTREQFEIIKSLLESARKTTKPRDLDLYDVFCAILYLIKEGCTWRGIPGDFPKSSAVRYYYDIWSTPDDNGQSLLDKILRILVEAEREKVGRAPETTMAIVDSKSVQNADTAEVCGYDAGKKKPG